MEALGREVQRIGDHAPGKTLLIDGPSAFLQVLSHEGFATRYDDEYVVGIGFGCNRVEHMQEILFGHVPLGGLHFTVTAAMTAMEVAAQGTFPKQLTQRMFAAHIILSLSPEFQS